MPVSNKGGASNAWLEREPGYVPPQQVEDAVETVEAALDEQSDVQVKQARKRVTRGGKDV